MQGSCLPRDAKTAFCIFSKSTVFCSIERVGVGRIAVLKIMGIPFEINTGAIARGARKTPYPRREIADFIAANGGKFIMTSDCHHKDMLLCAFKEADEIYKGIEILDFEDLINNS